jgi:hypothetical protein
MHREAHWHEDRAQSREHPSCWTSLGVRISKNAIKARKKIISKAVQKETLLQYAITCSIRSNNGGKILERSYNLLVFIGFEIFYFQPNDSSDRVGHVHILDTSTR